MDARDREKRRVAEAAAARVEDGTRVGLGSGSTALLFVRALGERVASGLRVVGVPTSRATERAAREAAIPLDDLSTEPHLDLAVDGADEVDPRLRLVKGGGGALLREKIVAAASAHVLIVVDGAKLVERLGAFPIPVEVIPYAQALVARRVREMGVTPALRRAADGSPFVTDEGNHILDCPFGPLEDPEAVAAALGAIPGVVEHGLFLSEAGEVLVARGERVESLRRPGARGGGRGGG